jgi:hypothetical protein
MALAGQGVNTLNPTSPGELVLMKRDGKDAYYLTFGMTQALPSYTYHSVYNYDCYGTYNTYTDDYDNVSFTHREHEQGDKSCFKIGGDNTYKTSGPLVFGAITLDRRTPRSPMGSYHFIAGYYEPKSGVIEGSETYSAPDCLSATWVDPLAYFTAEIDSHLHIPHNGLVDSDGSATCRAYYIVHWRIELPNQQ